MRHLLIAFAALLFIGCNSNTPEDPSTKNQPEDPTTWSPVGKTYVSTDSSHYGRYLGKKIIFLPNDSIYMDFQTPHTGRYILKYPLIYWPNYETPWLKFLDTLTITKAYELSDESACYELER